MAGEVDAGTREEAEAAISLAARRGQPEAQLRLVRRAEADGSFEPTVLYDAACAAALLAQDRQQDGAALRAEALRWLRQVLRGKPERELLRHALEDGDLNDVRDPARLAELDQAERVRFEVLWAEIRVAAGEDR